MGSSVLDKSQLLAEVIKSKHAELRLISNATDLQSRDAALFITKGTALLRDHSVFDSNIHSTQTFSAGDSIYLAATLSKRPLDRTYTIHEPLEVVSVDGSALRTAVMNASFLVNEIVRNSVTRIYATKQRVNPVFEDRFLIHYKDLFRKSSFRKDQPIFLVGEPPKGLYFIAKGSVFLTTEDHAKFAELYETDFFGEGSIITSTDRSKNVYAMEDCSLLLLERQLVLEEINRETPLVKLVLSHIFNLLELMNQLRFSHLEGAPPGDDSETQQSH